MPFTLNFTITNLRCEEDMQRPGSWKFNSTERILQGLVRAPPTCSSRAPCHPRPAHRCQPRPPVPAPRLASAGRPSHLFPIHFTNTPAPRGLLRGSFSPPLSFLTAQPPVQEQQSGIPLFRLHASLAQVRLSPRTQPNRCRGPSPTGSLTLSILGTTTATDTAHPH